MLCQSCGLEKLSVRDEVCIGTNDMCSACWELKRYYVEPIDEQEAIDEGLSVVDETWFDNSDYDEPIIDHD